MTGSQIKREGASPATVGSVVRYFMSWFWQHIGIEDKDLGFFIQAQTQGRG